MKAMTLASPGGLDHIHQVEIDSVKPPLTIDVGGAATLSQSLEAVKVGGHVAMVGLLGGIAADLPVIPMLAKQVRLQGCLAGSRQDQIDLVAFLEKHRIHPVIDRSYDLEQLAQAFAFQRAGGHFGKVVIRI